MLFILCVVIVLKMFAYHLRKSEIEYELRIRGLSVRGNANELRKQLSQAITNNILVDDDVVSKLKIEVELEQAEEKLGDLTSLVEECEGSFKEKELCRLQARLTHLHNRIERIPVDDSSDQEDEVLQKEELLNKVKALMDLLKTSASGTVQTEVESPPAKDDNQQPPSAMSQTTSTARTQAANAEKQQLEAAVSPSQIASNYTSQPNPFLLDGTSEENMDKPNVGMTNSKTNPSNLEYGNVRMRSIPVYKWGVRYDNESGQSIGAFLERVEELRRARGVSEQELFESAVDLFAGTALVWYRSTIGRINSWAALCKEMRIVFQTPDYDFRLHQEIFNRVQGDHEPIDLFIAAMEGLYGRLDVTVNEPERLRQIMQNIHPHLMDRLALFDILNLEQLRQLGRKAETGRLRSLLPRSIPRGHGAMEPDLAYVDQARRRGPAVGRIASLNPSTADRYQNFKCWNCGSSGHRHAMCKVPRKRFCYGCGAPDTIRANCMKCRPKNL